MSYQSVNPADGKALKTFEELTDKELEGKIAAAAGCFDTWKRKTYAERRRSSPRPPPSCTSGSRNCAHVMTLEMGKRIDEARGEVEFSASILAYYAKNAERFLAPVEAPSDSWRGAYGEQPDRRDLRRRAVELSRTISSPASPVRT